MFLLRSLKIVFDRTPEDTIDLFETFPFIRHFFERRRLHAVIRTAGDIIFAFIIFEGLFGPQDPERNCILYLSWGLWWPTIVLSWFFVGRMWCGFCPFPGLGRLVQNFGLRLDFSVPLFLLKNGPYISVFLLALIIWVEESTGIKESPRATAFLILSIMAGATIMAIFYPKQAWCRYLCPMGRLLGVGSTLSLLEFRPDLEKCKGCKTFACKKGIGEKQGCPVYLGAFNVKNNLDCLVCGHCLSLCERSSPRLNLRSPFKELLINKGRFITCFYIIPFFIGSQLVRFFRMSSYSIIIRQISTGFESMLAYSGLLVIGFFYVFFFIKIGARFFGITEDELFGKFSPLVPLFVPLAFGGELAYRMDFAVANAPTFFPTVARQFNLTFLENITFFLPPWSFLTINLFCFGSAVIASQYLLYRFITDEFEGMVTRWRAIMISCLILSMGTTYFIFMLSITELS